LFADDMQNAVTFNQISYDGMLVVRPASTASVTEDLYVFQVTCPQDYVFNVIGTGGTPLVSTDPAGLNSAPVNNQGGGSATAAEYTLAPGVYYLHVPASSAGPLNYVLNISMLGKFERPTPLSLGASPAIRLRLVSNVPPPPVATVPPASGPTNSGDLPSSVLVALGSGPLGGSGPGTTNPIGVDLLGRVVAQAPRLLRSDEVVQLVSLLEVLDLGSAGIATDEMAPAVWGGELRNPWLAVPWGKMVDFLSNLWNAVDQSALEINAEDPDMGEQGLDLGRAEPEKSRVAGDLGGWALAGVAAGCWLGADPQRRTRGQPLAWSAWTGQNKRRCGAL
jgi:hypothetical protein